MSWNGFKKAVHRALAPVSVKAGDKALDKDFDIEDRRYQQLRKAGQALQKALKGYRDLLRSVSAAQVSIAEIVSNPYDQGVLATGQNYSQVGQTYLQTVRDLEEATVEQVVGPVQETILDPITAFSNYFTETDAAIKKRAHKKTDLELCKAKVRKLTDKPAKDAAKLPQAEKELALAKDIYEELNDQLKAELPQLVALRVPFFDPSFEALVKIHKRFCTESYARLAQVQQYLDPQLRDDYAEGKLDGKMDDLIIQMNLLNIATLAGKV